ncbi:MAG: M14 family zinc carboxypeptidase [Patescibacteria group bacterium]
MTATLKAQLADELFNFYDSFKARDITSRRFTQTDLFQWLKPFEEQKLFQKSEVGKSAEGRTIYLLTLGTGTTKVLLWSQMHGDEPTATMALVDMLSFMSRNPGHPAVVSIREKLSLLIVPLLNPDGAERFQRSSAQQIDLNRDALRLETPEARVLKDIQQQYKPEFGFNLHDQDPRYTVGESKNVTAIALLAPAMNEARSDSEVRTRAKKVAATVSGVLHHFIPGHVAKYDDTFEPRAFGDNIQKWGTSTVLIESGGWPDDRDKMFLRKLNYVCLLSTLSAIADGSFVKADLSAYENLPFNTKNLYDVIIRNAQLKSHGVIPAAKVDIGFNIEEQLDASTKKIQLMAKVVDIGDLSRVAAFEELEGGNALLDGDRIQLDRVIPYSELKSFIQKR